MEEREPRHHPTIEREYRDERIAVTWEPALCTHTANCLRGLPEVFDARRRPWIDISEADADEIARVVETCPTGALHYTRLDGGPQEQHAETTVQPVRNGPLYVRGPVEIRAPDGTLIRRDTRLALCRCGASKNKPYCDNSHRAERFRAD